jgi:hypothetical protein
VPGDADAPGAEGLADEPGGVDAAPVGDAGGPVAGGAVAGGADVGDAGGVVGALVGDGAGGGVGEGDGGGGGGGGGGAVHVCVTRFEVTVWEPKACANSTSWPVEELVKLTLAVPSAPVVAVRGQPVLGPELCSKLTHTLGSGAGGPLPGGPETVAVIVCVVPTSDEVPDGASVTEPMVAREEVQAACAGDATTSPSTAPHPTSVRTTLLRILPRCIPRRSGSAQSGSSTCR